MLSMSSISDTSVLFSLTAFFIVFDFLLSSNLMMYSVSVVLSVNSISSSSCWIMIPSSSPIALNTFNTSSSDANVKSRGGSSGNSTSSVSSSISSSMSSDISKSISGSSTIMSSSISKTSTSSSSSCSLR